MNRIGPCVAAAAIVAGAAATPAVSHHRVANSPSLQALLDSPGVDLPFNPQLASVSCPVDRAPVKEGSDSSRFKVSTTITKVSVAYLRGRAKPSSYPRNSRVTGTELHTYQVTAYLIQYK